MNNKERLSIAAKAAIEAGIEILKIYESDDFGVQSKKDDSPLTQADLAANTIINAYLKNTDTPIISEENKEIAYTDRKDWTSCWIVDPLDGTKEFIKRNGEFTVNIAYVVNGAPQLGVIYVPVTRELYYADVSTREAYKSMLTKEHRFVDSIFSINEKIAPSKQLNGTIRVVGSRSHMNKDTEDFVAALKADFNDVQIVSKGSSLKFCLVAEGKADVYPRFAPTMEWDTAAGHAICNAVGLRVTSKDTEEELGYNKENLLNSYFIVKSE